MIQLSKWRGRTVLGTLVAVFVFSSCEEQILFPGSGEDNNEDGDMTFQACLSPPPPDMSIGPCLSPPLEDMDMEMVPDFGPCLSPPAPDLGPADMSGGDMGDDMDMDTDMTRRAPTRRDLLEKFRDRLPGDVLAALSDHRDPEA